MLSLGVWSSSLIPGRPQELTCVYSPLLEMLEFWDCFSFPTIRNMSSRWMLEGLILGFLITRNCLLIDLITF